MKIAFMFPGQGAQYPGMAKDIYNEYEEVRNVYKKASTVLNVDMEQLCFESTQEELSKTQNAQIAIAVTSLGILEVLKKHGIEADVLTGLSLGEYVALMFSNILSYEDGLKLLKKRGYYMGNFIPDETFLMCAVIGLESSKIEEICKEISTDKEYVAPANYNYSMQTVISGNSIAVEKAIEKLKEAGAKKVIKLNTSGPFHTKKLEKAKELYKKELETTVFNKPLKTVLKNIDGKEYDENTNMVETLANHIISPVRFDKIIANMKEKGIDTFIEIGPRKSNDRFYKKRISRC